MAGKRIYELTEKTNLESGDYFAIDRSGLNDARKFSAAKILDQFANIADSSDEYDSTKAYFLWDLVIHDNKLYYCNSDCAAGSWSTNQGHFTQTSLASFTTQEIKELKWRIRSGTINAYTTGSAKVNFNYDFAAIVFVGRQSFDRVAVFFLDGAGGVMTLHSNAAFTCTATSSGSSCTGELATDVAQTSYYLIAKL